METFRDLDNFNEKIITETVYHSGDFARKADVLGQMAGRSTGYFGTGYYFCTNPEKVENLGDDRPIYSFTTDGLNLFIGTINAHDNLKVIQKYVSVKPWLDNTPNDDEWYHLTYYYNELFGEWDKKNKLGKNLKYLREDEYYDFDTGKYVPYESWKQAYDGQMEDDYHFKHLIPLIDSIDGLKEISEEIHKDEPNFDLIDELDDGTYFNHKELEYARKVRRDYKFSHFYLNVREEELDKVVNEVVEELRPYYGEDGILISWASDIANTDSIPTRVLRKLGFDGVYPTPECDSTTYGGCIFDKENIKNLKRIR